jgi:Spy/CpxP family protein refolding chaperone
VKQYIQERRALHSTIHATPVNKVAIRAQAGRVAQLEGDLAVRRAHRIERVRTVLIPEQITKLKELTTQLDSRVDAMVERISNNIAGP